MVKKKLPASTRSGSAPRVAPRLRGTLYPNHRSSGQPKACFAAFSPPLTSTLGPFQAMLFERSCGLSPCTLPRASLWRTARSGGARARGFMRKSERAGFRALLGLVHSGALRPSKLPRVLEGRIPRHAWVKRNCPLRVAAVRPLGLRQGFELRSTLTVGRADRLKPASRALVRRSPLR